MPILICQQCGRMFEVAPSREHSARYCSKECQLAATQKKEAKCECCGKEFNPLNRNNPRFCSRICASAAQSGLSLEAYLAKKAQPRQTPTRESICARGLPARAVGGGSLTTDALNVGKSCVKAQTLRGFPHTNFTEEDPGRWNGTGRAGLVPPWSALPRRAPRPVLCGLVERVRGADVDVTERVRQRRELLPPVLREEAGHC